MTHHDAMPNPLDARQAAQQQFLLSVAGRMAHLGGWTIDLSTGEVEWSNEVCDIHGVPHGTRPTLATGLAYYAPEHREQITRAVEACARDGVPFDLVLQLDTRRNGRRWVRALGEPVRDAHGAIVRMQGAFQDVHERIVLQEASASLARRLVSTLDSVTDAFYLLDREWRFAFVNAEAERLVERRREDILGTVVWESFPEARGSAVHVAYQRAVDTGEAQTLRFFFPPLDRWFDIRAFPSVEGLAVYFRDVTAERSTEQRLREQAALIEEAHDAILVRSLDHTVLAWNRGAERLYGWPASEAIGQSVETLLYDDPAKLYEGTRAVLANGEWHGELAHRTRDGHLVAVEAHWSLLRDEQGRPARILAINTDITERKQLLAQFLRSQRMESIGTLAGGIAHDLNNVLAPILLSIAMLRESVNDAESLDTLSVIESSARRGANMIGQLLGFARGFERLDKEVPVASLVDEALRVVRDTFPRNITIQCTVDTVSAIRGDPTQMHQVLINLLLNARDAMPAGGQIIIDVRDENAEEPSAVRTDGSPVDRRVRLTVSDTGLGMDTDVLSQIFDPFFTTKEVGKGTGLGLSTVAAIVRNHRGTIDVQSLPGQGTVFTLVFPAVVADPTQRPPVPETTLRGKNELILVVDDELPIREVARRTLERFGYRVVTAADGVEALAVFRARASEIALVLTDMSMPNLDGPGTVRALRELDPSVRIIAMSGLFRPGSEEHAGLTGVRHFIPKPFSTETLLHDVRMVLGDEVPHAQ